MSAHVKLTSLRWLPGGFEELSVTVAVGTSSFELPLPCQFVAGSTAICPDTVVDHEAETVTFRMNRWGVFNAELKRFLPLVLGDMSTAVRAARDFGADSGVSWRSDQFEIGAWATAWIERNNEASDGEAA